jgi:DNA-binding CsgD family transcriptional regulator
MPGDVAGAAEDVERARDALGDVADSMWAGPLTAGRVELSLLEGKPEEAARVAEDAAAKLATGEVEYAFYTARLYDGGLRALADLAERARSAGDRKAVADIEQRAAALLDRLRDLLGPDYWEAAPPADSLAHLAAAEAETARAAGRPAPELWEDVARRWGELGYPLALAYAQHRMAEALLLSDGDKEAVAELLRAAAAKAADHGGAPLLTEIEALARRARVALSDGPAAGTGDQSDALAGFGLTARELEVLELVADGKTNREIGAVLFISEKTASVHVSRILAKLDVRGRVEAATVAYRLGIGAGG